jgi:predicted NBD/HSP70 family sugar kinase
MQQKAERARVANVIAAYDPELITLGGSVTMNNQRLMLNSITKFVPNYAINRIPEIAVTPLGQSKRTSLLASYPSNCN